MSAKRKNNVYNLLSLNNPVFYVYLMLKVLFPVYLVLFLNELQSIPSIFTL